MEPAGAGVVVEGGKLAPLRNTTQSGEKCAKHALRPAVTLFNTLGEICAFAFLPSPTVTWKLQSGLKRGNQVLWLKYTHALRASCLKQQALEAPTLVDYLYKNQAPLC